MEVSNSLLMVSVVIPVFNGAATIGRCIEALLAQTYPKDHYEIIVVDNNSTDDTDDIVKRYPVTLLYEREIQSSYAARNRGICHAQSEIIAFTDADCVPTPSWLETVVIQFSEPRVNGVAGQMEPGVAVGLVGGFLNTTRPVCSKISGNLLAIPTANAAYRRQILLDVGLFNAALHTAGDVDLAWRVQLQGSGKVVEAPAAIVYHQYGNTWRELYHRYSRYGYSEVLLDTMYRKRAFYPRTPGQQLRQMIRQVWAVFTYVASFSWRLFQVLLKGWNSKYNLWPILWLVAESGNLVGKLRALWKTRGFRRVPGQSTDRS